jgi:hypothetical protein
MIIFFYVLMFFHTIYKNLYGVYPSNFNSVLFKQIIMFNNADVNISVSLYFGAFYSRRST